MNTDEFSVYQFFPNDRYERPMANVSAGDAHACAMHLATSVGAKIGTTRRVIITDGGDFTVWEWKYGEGLVYPPVPNIPPSLQPHAPHEFDCEECGRHIIEFSGQVHTRCATCIHVLGWYNNPMVADALDPEHARKV